VLAEKTIRSTTRPQSTEQPFTKAALAHCPGPDSDSHSRDSSDALRTPRPITLYYRTGVLIGQITGVMGTEIELVWQDRSSAACCGLGSRPVTKALGRS